MAPRHAALAAALLLAGCGAAPREPDWVRWTSEPPPPDRAELFAPPVEPGTVWVTGHWVKEETGWTWQRGTYAAPPAPNAVWVPGRWVEKDAQWAWVDGGWR